MQLELLLLPLLLDFSLVHFCASSSSNLIARAPEARLRLDPNSYREFRSMYSPNLIASSGRYGLRLVPSRENARRERQGKCQIECQNRCQTECQIECQIDCQNRCQKECQIICQKECQIECQVECPNIDIYIYTQYILTIQMVCHKLCQNSE